MMPTPPQDIGAVLMRLLRMEGVVGRGRAAADHVQLVQHPRRIAGAKWYFQFFFYSME
jgi:hypothetical protein